MFKVTESHRFAWPVEVRLPSATDPGKIEVSRFTGRFVLLTKARSAELAEAMDKAKGSDAIAAQEMAQIREVLVGWGDDVVDDDGLPVAFSPEALEDACRFQAVREAIAVAYAEAASGKARLGN